MKKSGCKAAFFIVRCPPLHLTNLTGVRCFKDIQTTPVPKAYYPFLSVHIFHFKTIRYKYFHHKKQQTTLSGKLSHFIANISSLYV